MTEVRTMRPPVRVALLGLGRAVFTEHLPVLLENRELFRIVAACDVLRERRDLLERDCPDCKMFRQAADMLDERDIDLVLVATTTSMHVRHALLSLRRGHWTLLETPMALTLDEAQVLRGQAQKSRNRLIVLQRGMFSPDYLLARMAMADGRLGQVHQIRVRCEDFIRRDDWQCVKRLGGGAAYYAMPDLILQTLKLLPAPPVQMWSELKRLASLGDAEDYAHVCLKTREQVSADIEFNGGALPGERAPSFEIRGERGVFKVMPGASQGTVSAIDPAHSFPRRRSSVRTPPIRDMHEKVPVTTFQVSLPAGEQSGPAAFWQRVYDTVRTAAPFPLTLEDSIEAVKFSHLMKKSSPYGK